MNFNKKIFMVLIPLALLALLMTMAADATSPYLELGKKMKVVKNDTQQEKVVATINGEPVKKYEYESKKLFLKEAKSMRGESEPSADEILKEIAKERLMYQEAQKRGLSVSDDYVKNVMNTIREDLKKTSDRDRQAVHMEFNKGMGISEEEYWNDKRTFEGYKKLLSIGKLRNQITVSLNIPSEKAHDPETALMLQQKIQEFENDLIKNVIIDFKMN